MQKGPLVASRSDGTREDCATPAARVSSAMKCAPRAVHQRMIAVASEGSMRRPVTALGCDTCAEEDRFFSYRRATHRKEPDYGRLLSAITIVA